MLAAALPVPQNWIGSAYVWLPCSCSIHSNGSSMHSQAVSFECCMLARDGA